MDYSEDDEPNDPKPFYLELRDLFAKLAKEIATQCPSLPHDGMLFTEEWNRIAKDFNELVIEIEAMDSDGSKRDWTYLKISWEEDGVRILGTGEFIQGN